MTAQLILLAEAQAVAVGVAEPLLTATLISLEGAALFTADTAEAEAAEMKALEATVKAAS
tara:strand:- start:815 stop:994 length:180 start_codon:yes stop_codon:yes gene_type:complete